MAQIEGGRPQRTVSKEKSNDSDSGKESSPEKIKNIAVKGLWKQLQATTVTAEARSMNRQDITRATGASTSPTSDRKLEESLADLAETGSLGRVIN